MDYVGGDDGGDEEDKFVFSLSKSSTLLLTSFRAGTVVSADRIFHLCLDVRTNTLHLQSEHPQLSPLSRVPLSILPSYLHRSKRLPRSSLPQCPRSQSLRLLTRTRTRQHPRPMPRKLLLRSSPPRLRPRNPSPLPSPPMARRQRRSLLTRLMLL